jgi:hypothetical protein
VLETLAQLEQTVQVECDQKLDIVLSQLLTRMEAQRFNSIDLKLRQYVVLKLALHRLKRNLRNGDIDFTTFCQGEVKLLAEIKQAREHYYSAKVGIAIGKLAMYAVEQEKRVQGKLPKTKIIVPNKDQNNPLSQVCWE